mmetsp:Transcript_5745/g.13076  ORF Transcript_5745/g.13076 Transcript_5745/m.13076 type:complete len:92 (+) Transcript_5745:53-328(+)
MPRYLLPFREDHCNAQTTSLNTPAYILPHYITSLLLCQRYQANIHPSYPQRVLIDTATSSISISHMVVRCFFNTVSTDSDRTNLTNPKPLF